MECPDEIRGIPNVFLGFPACGFRGVIKALPFNKVEETRPLQVADLEIGNGKVTAFGVTFVLLDCALKLFMEVLVQFLKI